MYYRGFTMQEIDDILHKLGGAESLRRLLAGDRKIRYEIVNHVINLEESPYYNDEFACPASHVAVRDLWTWNTDELELITFPLQESSKEGILGHVMHTKLEGRKNLNACVCDYLLLHQELIPKEWKKLKVCFWGTIFATGYSRNDNRTYFVPALFWEREKGWRSVWVSLDQMFTNNYVALVLK